MVLMSCAPADKTTPTCRNCDGNNCSNNILEDIIADGLLTSGYFSLKLVGATKPKGTERDLLHS